MPLPLLMPPTAPATAPAPAPAPARPRPRPHRSPQTPRSPSPLTTPRSDVSVTLAALSAADEWRADALPSARSACSAASSAPPPAPPPPPPGFLFSRAPSLSASDADSQSGAPSPRSGAPSPRSGVPTPHGAAPAAGRAFPEPDARAPPPPDKEEALRKWVRVLETQQMERIRQGSVPQDRAPAYRTGYHSVVNQGLRALGGATAREVLRAREVETMASPARAMAWAGRRVEGVESPVLRLGLGGVGGPGSEGEGESYYGAMEKEVASLRDSLAHREAQLREMARQCNPLLKVGLVLCLQLRGGGREGCRSGRRGTFTHARTHAPTHSSTHSLTDSSAHSPTHPITHPPNHPSTHPLTHSITHSPTHLLTHSLTHSLTHPLTNSLTHSLTHSPTHSLTNSLNHSLILAGLLSLSHLILVFATPASPVPLLCARFPSTRSLTHPPTHPQTHPPNHPSTHPLTHSITHSPTHPLSHSPTHSLNHPCTHSLTNSLTHSLILAGLLSLSLN